MLMLNDANTLSCAFSCLCSTGPWARMDTLGPWEGFTAWKLGPRVGMWQLHGCRQWEEVSLGDGAGSGHTLGA